MALAHKPGTMLSFKCTDALDEKGYVLALADDGTVHKCAVGARYFGVAFKDTKNPITDSAEDNRNVPVIVDGVAYVQYEIGAGEDIKPGDYVTMENAHSAGKVTVFTDGGNESLIVGIALEAVDAPAAGTKTGLLKVLLVRL